jgi:hypothetical protein
VTNENPVSANVTPQDYVVFTEFDGGEGVLVDLNTKRYFQLNETATLIWRGLESGRPASEIVEELTTSYEVTPEHAVSSLDRLLQNLLTYKLVRAQD